MARFNVSFVLFDAFSNMVLACLLEPLRVVRDQLEADISWTILTEGDRQLASSSGLKIAPDMKMGDSGSADMVVLVGGDVFRDEKGSVGLRHRLDPLISGATVVAADTGAWILARCGYLQGRKATVHWQILEEFAETFPEVTVLSDRVVKDGRFWTCGSAAAALDMMLDFIRGRFGPAASFDAGAMFLHDNSRRYGDSYPDQVLSSSMSKELRRVIRLMSESLEHPRQISDLATEAHISERSLHRLFREELGVAPGQYYTLLRLARARELALFSDRTPTDIALRCGFSSAATLTRSFRKQYGTSLSALSKSKK